MRMPKVFQLFSRSVANEVVSRSTESYPRRETRSQRPTEPKEARTVESDNFNTYLIQPAVGSSVDKRSKLALSVEWGFDSIREDIEVDATERDTLFNVFNYPNADETFSVMLLRTIALLDIHGDCYWHVQYRKPTQQATREAIRQVLIETAEQVSLDTSASGVLLDEIMRETYRQVYPSLGFPVGAYIIEGTVVPNKDEHGNFKDPDKAAYHQVVKTDKIPLGLGDVIHFKMPDPRQSTYGLSRLSHLRFTNIMDQEAQSLNESVLRRRGFLGGILSLRNVSPRERDRIEADFKDKFIGSDSNPEAFDKAGGFMVVEVMGQDGKVEWVPVRDAASDVQFEKLLMYSRSQMDSVMGINVALRGGEKLNREEYDALIYDLVQNEFDPYLELVAQEFNRHLHQHVQAKTCKLYLRSRDLRSETERIGISQKLANLGLETMDQRLNRWGHEKVLGGACHMITLPGAAGTLFFQRDVEPFLLTMQQGIIPLGDYIVPSDQLAGARRVEPMPFLSSTPPKTSPAGESGQVPSPSTGNTAAKDLVTQLLQLREQLQTQTGGAGSDDHDHAED